MSKHELRKRMATILNRLSSFEKQQQSREVFTKLIQHPKYVKAKRLFVYLSTDNEIDTKPILEQALEVDNKQCFIPFVRKSNNNQEKGDDKFHLSTRMLMVQLNSMREYDELPMNHYGIKEHKDPIRANLNIAKPLDQDDEDHSDLVLVPGVAFALDGRRLGHGKGYYDEFLTKWIEKRTRLYTIGLALRQQLVEDPLAVDGLDFKLNEVLFASS